MGGWDAAIRRIPDPALRELAAGGEVRTFPRGECLMREGDAGDAFYILLAGRVEVYVSDARGREMILAHYGPGEHVGEMALDGRPRSASVRALERTACSMVARDALRAAIAANPDVALHLVATLIARTRTATLNLKDLALMDVYGRVARLLLAQETVPEADGARWSRERLTQQEIANRVGASRDMISRILKDLRAGGYIEQRERRFRIVRRPPARW